MIMPFGKHKGEEVDALPFKYIQWLEVNCKLYGELETAVAARLGKDIETVALDDDDLDPWHGMDEEDNK
jgi:uncharacterized protein (DUF3820 family)